MSTHIVLLALLWIYIASTTVLPLSQRDFPNRSGRSLGLVGGNNTTIEKHPYQVSISFSGEFFGAGVILNKTWVLTSADCVNPFFWDLNILTGSSYKNRGTRYKSDKIIFHPRYDNKRKDFNLALVHISGSGIKFSERAMPIEIAARPLKVGQYAVTSGWGYSLEASEVFKELRVRRSKQRICKNHYGSYHSVTKNTICTVAHKAGPCLFDWGNPLVFRHKLVGLCSFYGDCGNDAYPGVFSNIHSSYWWIRRTIKT